MPAGRDPDAEAGDPVVADAETLKTAWERTLAELAAIAEDRRERGETVATAAAGDTTLRSPADDADRTGLVLVVGDDDAAAVAEVLEAGDLPAYDVFRRTVNRRVFFVLALADPGERAVLVAGQYRLADAAGLARAACEAGETHTHLRRLDGSHVATFRHESPAKFFPERLRARE